jgi:acetylornithine deacetylase/succinyl-diaminopimelate desuccinylase-like protein
VRQHPEAFASDAGVAAAALNEVGGYSITLAGRRFYTLQVAEKGIIWGHIRADGTPGHGSMPHGDNAALHLAEAALRLAREPRAARPGPVTRRFFEGLGLGDLCDLAVAEPAAAEAALTEHVPDPVLRRSFNAMLRDTVTPTVLRAGKKVNVIPGEAHAEVDVRTLPDTDQAAFLAELQRLAGERVSVEPVIILPAVEWPADAEIVSLAMAALRDADPDATTLPMMITPGTDAKHLLELGIPTYGFAPLRLDADMPFLSLFHGHDERVPVSALEFGLPVLDRVVRRFAARR